jgi:methionine-rich copper-binding protein CopC
MECAVLKRKSLVRPSFGLLVVLLLIVAGPISASAHAELQSANPASGSTIESLPAAMSLTFSEEVKPGGITVTVSGPDGARVDTGDAAVDLTNAARNVVTVSLYGGGPGDYAVHWDSVSNLDGDEASGDYTFSVAGPGTAAIGDVAVATPTLDPDANGNPLSKDSQFDSKAFFLSLGAGALALILIIGFWLRVRPKSPKFGSRAGRK